jgi:transcriptional repressor NrdR
MKCPFCGHANDRVLDTRVQKDGSIRRRRECLECKARFTTAETILLAFPFIIKKDGRREPFSKEKILKGLQAACSKRPVSLIQMEAVVERIAAWVINRGESEISSRLIGKKVMLELKQLDDVAYIRFASVYRTFKDVQEFVETLEDTELLDFADSGNPQLSLTAMNFVESDKDSKNETDDKKTSARTRPASSISN